MKNILAENMLRYGTKNLTEAQKQRLNEQMESRPYEMVKPELKIGTSEINGFYVPVGQGARFFKDGCIMIWNGSTGLIYGPTYYTVFADKQFTPEEGEAAAKNAKTMLSVIGDGNGKGLYAGEQPFTGDSVLQSAANFFSANFISQHLKSFITQTKLPAPTKIKTQSELQAAMTGNGSLAKIPQVTTKYQALSNAFGLV